MRDRGAVFADTDIHARRTMKANRRRDTAPELAVRRLLHARGLRYRVDYRLAPQRRTRADIVFTKRGLAVFIDGCFWHDCPNHATQPKRHAGYWGPKLARNIERDRETDVALRELGWTVLRFWEHENPVEVVEAIITASRERPPASNQ